MLIRKKIVWRSIPLLLVLSTPFPSAAQEEDWHLIHTSGEKPDRHLFFARQADATAPLSAVDEFLKKGAKGGLKGLEALKANYRGAAVTEIFESSTAPASSTRSLSFKCDSDTVKEDWNVTGYRDDRNERNERIVEQPWGEISTPWQQRAKDIACKPQQLRDGNSDLAGRGALQTSQLVDIAWSSFWKDGTRPPYTTKRSLQEIQAQLDEQNATLTQTVSDVRKKVSRDIEADQEDARITATHAGNRANATDPRLETWVGATEQQLVATWGQPAKFSQERLTRLLTYSDGYSTETRNQGGAGAVVGTSHHYCDITFSIRDGKVATYYLDSTSGYCREMNMPLGPGR